MMLSFGVAKELGYTVQELWDRITPEELVGWSCYFGIINRQQKQAMEKSQAAAIDLAELIRGSKSGFL